MGLNKRFISDESLLMVGSKNFESFNHYMTKSDCYVNEGEYAPAIHDFYFSEKEIRENIWRIINSNYENKSNIIKAVSKSWSIVNNRMNTPEHEESTRNFFDLLINMSKEHPECPSDDVYSIVSTLKKKII